MGHIAHLRSMNTFEQSYYYIYYKIGPILVEIGPVVSEKKIFFNLSMYFCYFVSISSWKIAGPFICSNLNSLHQCMFCTMFGWNWPSGSGEDENVKSSCQQRRQWRQQTMDKFWSEKLTWAFGSGEIKTSLPCSPIWKKTSLESHSLKNALFQVSLKLAWWIWREDF